MFKTGDKVWTRTSAGFVEVVLGAPFGNGHGWCAEIGGVPVPIAAAMAFKTRESAENGFAHADESERRELDRGAEFARRAHDLRKLADENLAESDRIAMNAHHEWGRALTEAVR